MYGLIDTAVVSVSSGGSTDGNNPGNINNLNSYGAAGANSANAATSGRVLGMASGQTAGSRWGIKGNEDLGSGLKANFVLEGALNSAAGTAPNDHALLASKDAAVTGAGDSAANGQLFSRQATVGLSGGFGSIDIGFQASSNVDALVAIDPLMLGGASPIGFYSSWIGSGSSDTRMANNSIKWKYNFNGGSQLTGFYAMGGNTGSTSQGQQLGLVGKFQVTPGLYVVAAGHKMNDNVSYNSAPIAINTYAYNSTPGVTATVAGYAPGLSATYFNSSTAILGLSYQVASNLELRAGYERVNQSNASNPAGDALILQNLGIALNPAKIVTTAYVTNPSRNITWIGGTYDVSAMDHVKVAYYSAKLNGYQSAAAPASNTVYDNNKYNVLAVQYLHDLSKRTTVYALLSAEKENAVSGNSQLPGANVNGQTTNTYGVGIRHSF